MKTKKMTAILMTSVMAAASLGTCAFTASAEEATDVKAALICSTSGLGDNSFNDSAWEGFNKANEELGVEVNVVEPADVADYLSTASALAESGYDLIFATGSDFGDTLTEVAALYPDTCFVGLNVTAEGDNVAIARTADHELGFLAGALAAMMSESGTVGFLGGKDNPSQERFNVGYCEGAAYIDENVEVLTTYVGAFDDPSTGKEYALEMISQGADVIYHTAGQSGQGLFEAVSESEGVYAIGVDSNQDAQVEGKVLTSTLKRLDTIAYDMIQNTVNGEFESGIVVYNLANGGVSLTDFEYTADVIGEENLAQLEELEQGIIDGTITVTDTYDE